MSKNKTATTTAATADTSAAKRSATIEKNRQERIAQRGYALPLVLTCKVTGKEVKYTSPAYIDKVIAKHGGNLADLQKNFVSREGRRANAPAKAPKAVKAPKAAKVDETAAPATV